MYRGVVFRGVFDFQVISVMDSYYLGGIYVFFFMLSFVLGIWETQIRGGYGFCFGGVYGLVGNLLCYFKILQRGGLGIVQVYMLIGSGQRGRDWSIVRIRFNIFFVLLLLVLLYYLKVGDNQEGEEFKDIRRKYRFFLQVKDLGLVWVVMFYGRNQRKNNLYF